jgi:prolyl-tRNA editing enzyme YbaK/EbsC (Cys-tRNA(Pro) deacylase)
MAAAALGCEVARIVKSLVFRGAESGAPVLVLASGANRVDEHKVAALIGEGVERADAGFVRAVTGYAIGGVAPLGHVRSMDTLVDRDLLELATLWAAAGTPEAVFEIEPARLVALTGGRVAELRA